MAGVECILRESTEDEEEEEEEEGKEGNELKEPVDASIIIIVAVV